jgi:hypothetical protein
MSEEMRKYEVRLVLHVLAENEFAAEELARGSVVMNPNIESIEVDEDYVEEIEDDFDDFSDFDDLEDEESEDE